MFNRTVGNIVVMPQIILVRPQESALGDGAAGLVEAVETRQGSQYGVVVKAGVECPNIMPGNQIAFRRVASQKIPLQEPEEGLVDHFLVHINDVTAIFTHE